ncbi:MAG: glycerol-3-phosphate 1-O-acyltransferase PlsY [Lachnospiraceae bacterium]|nr:glycerol-3-phosphate 1-O-acyltransferase PlsY [Lachnospiraceae bacterium]
MKTAALMVLGYLVGSIPFALVIGKVFYHKDVRQYGSGNLGGGNTGRVLGKKAGLSVMALDLLKVSLVALLAKLLTGDDTAVAMACLAAGIGHCFPVFAHFKGGKAVAAMYGYLFGLVTAAGRSPLYFFLPLAIFLIVIFFSKIIALASIVSAAAVTAYVWWQPEILSVRLVLLVFALLILVRHRPNLERMLRHEENKVKWVPDLGGRAGKKEKEG